MATVGILGRGVVAGRLRLLLPAHRILDLHVGDTAAVPPVAEGVDVVVLATGGSHAEVAAAFVAAGTHVVSTSGRLTDVRELLELDDAARGTGATVVVGAAVSPGLSGLLARHLVGSLAGCDELHIAVHGTAGPACAREHHDSLSGWAVGWHDGDWIQRTPAGSGRELCWFPEPVGARDCYRQESADPLLLHRGFTSVRRISARVSATRRDRLTARLPMLSPPHREGGVGALRVEARGHGVDGARVTTIVGIAERIGTATAAVAASFVDFVAFGRTVAGVLTSADEHLPAHEVLAGATRRGVRLQTFTGIPIA